MTNLNAIGSGAKAAKELKQIQSLARKYLAKKQAKASLLSTAESSGSLAPPPPPSAAEVIVAAKTESANITGSLSEFKDSLGAKLTVSDQNVAISHLNTICLNMNPPLPMHGGIFRPVIGSNKIEIFNKILFNYLFDQPTIESSSTKCDVLVNSSFLPPLQVEKTAKQLKAPEAVTRTKSANITGRLSEFKSALGAKLTVSDQNVAISHLNTICLNMKPPLATHGDIFRRATGPNEIEIFNKRLFDHLFDLPTIQSPSTKHDTSGDSDMRRVLRRKPFA